jgi:hypothetical protein
LSTTAIEIEVDPVEPPAASGAPADAHGESDWSIEHLGEMGVGVSALRELAATATGCTGGTLIVNGLDTEPYRTENTKALVDEAARVIVAASNLHRTLGLRRIYLVSDAARRALTGRLRAAARGTPVRVVALQNRYPQGAAPLLVKAILKREIPIGCRPADLGAAVVEAGYARPDGDCGRRGATGTLPRTVGRERWPPGRRGRGARRTGERRRRQHAERSDDRGDGGGHYASDGRVAFRLAREWPGAANRVHSVRVVPGRVSGEAGSAGPAGCRGARGARSNSAAVSGGVHCVWPVRPCLPIGAAADARRAAVPGL